MLLKIIGVFNILTHCLDSFLLRNRRSHFK
ncbi:hypothetical protein [Vibrio brasiliensis]